MQKTMADLRADPPKAILGYAVTAVGDYQASLITHADGSMETVQLPKSNVLRFFLEGGMEAVVRPSGTEPKLKVYLTAIAPTQQESCQTVEAMSAYFTDLMNRAG